MASVGSAECHLTGVALRVLELGISELELAGLAAFLAWLGLGLARRKMVELALSLDRFLFQHSLGTVRQGATSRLIRTKRRLIGGWPTHSILTPGSTAKEAAPLAALFGEWAPRTSIPWSLVTDYTHHSVIDVANADQPASLLRRWIPSLHHYQLLSAKSTAGHAAESRSVSRSHGAGAALARCRGGWIRSDARARSSFVQRAGARRSLGGDEGPETVVRTAVAESVSGRGGSTAVLLVEDSSYRGTCLAASLLRFRRVHTEEAGGEAALHASQSRCPRSGAGAGTVELEQLPSLCFGRAGTSAGQ